MPSRLLADENIPAKGIQALRAAGLDVLSVREHAPGISDEAVLQLAVTHARILVTFDRDYGELIFGQGHTPPPSVIYLRIIPSDSREVSSVILSLLSDTASIEASMVIVSRQGIRRRRFHRPGP